MARIATADIARKSIEDEVAAIEGGATSSDGLDEPYRPAGDADSNVLHQPVWWDERLYGGRI